MTENTVTAPEPTAEPTSTSTAAMNAANEQAGTGTQKDQQQNQQDMSRFTELTAAANLQYSLKNYTAAADLFSGATELQASLRGEMAPENAELLYAYGRCLYQVAVSRSDVLGGKVGKEAAGGGAEKEKENRGKKRGRGGDEGLTSGEASAKGKERKFDVGEEQVGKATGGSTTALDSLPEVSEQPMFQFKGDENLTAPDDEEDDGDDGGADGDDDEGGAEDADEDDFANAYEILDLARILIARQRDELVASSGSSTANDNKADTFKSKIPSQSLQQQGGPDEPDKPTKSPLQHLNERLADIYDLQAEISLENERFTDAVADCRAALQLKKELYPPQSNLVAEAHFKLSLALEFASVTTTSSTSDGKDGDTGLGGSGGDSNDKQDRQDQQQQVDGKMREEAAQEMAAAIESCKLRIAEEEKVATVKGEDTADAQAMAEQKKREVADVKEMIEDMEQRLQDLRAPLLPQTTPASLLNSLLGGGGSGHTQDQSQSSTSNNNPASAGASAVAAAMSNATDLTSLVRRKEKDTDKSKDAPGKAVSGGNTSAAASADAKSEVNGKKEEGEKGGGMGKKGGKRGLLLDDEDGIGVSGDDGVVSASEGVAEGVKRVRVD